MSDKTKATKLPSQITVTQLRSTAGRTIQVKRGLQALGLGRIGKRKTFKQPNAALMGMVKKLDYLLEVKAE